MRRDLTTQAGLLTGSRALGQVFNALSGIFVVRVLSQFDYGTFRQLILLYTTILLVGDAAYSQTLFQFIPERREQARKFIGQALLVTLGMALVWTVGLVLLAAPLGRFFGNRDLVEHMLLLAVYIGLSLLAKSPETALINLDRVGSLSLNTAFFEGLKFALTLVVLYQGGGIGWLLRVMAVSAALKLLHLFWTLRDSIAFSASDASADQFRYAMVLWLPGVLSILGTYAHQYIVGHYFNPAEYAIYAVACFQVPLIGVLSNSVAELLLVRATEYHSQNRRDDLIQLWLSAHRKAQLILLPVTLACVALAGPLLTTLFTARYSSSVPLFIVMVLGLSLNGIFQDGLLRAYRAMRAYAFFSLLRVVLALSLGVLGARWMGLWGAALSTLATLVILNTAQLWKVAQLLEVPFSGVLPWKDLGKIGVTSSACAILAAATARLFSWAPAALGVGGAVFAVAYIAIGFWIGPFSRDETRTILKYIRGGFSRLGILRPETSGPAPR